MVSDNVFELHRLRKSFRFHPPRKPVDHHEELRQLREDVWNDENILCEDFQCAIDNQGEIDRRRILASNKDATCRDLCS